LNNFKVFNGSIANISNVLRVNNGDLVIDGTLNADATDNVISVSAGGTGNIDINGNVNVFGTDDTKGQSLTFGANNNLSIDGVFATNIGAAGKTTTLQGTNGTVTIGGSTDTTIIAGNQIVFGAST